MTLKFKPHYDEYGQVISLQGLTQYCGCDFDIFYDYVKENDHTVPTRIWLSNDADFPHRSLLSFLNGFKNFLVKFLHKQLMKYKTNLNCFISMECYYIDKDRWFTHDNYKADVFQLSSNLNSNTRKNIKQMLHNAFQKLEKENQENIISQEWIFHHICGFWLDLEYN